MISGAKSATPYYDIVFRTGAWGKDIVVPTVIAGALTAGIAAAPVAAIEALLSPLIREKILGIYYVKTYLKLGRERELCLPL